MSTTAGPLNVRPSGEHFPRGHRDLDAASLGTSHAGGTQAERPGLPKKAFQQIVGLNPFKTSYFSLFRPIDDASSRAILVFAIIFAIAGGVPLPIIGVIFGKLIDGFPPSEHELAERVAQLLGVGQ